MKKELEQLRARVAEAEETLRAIRNGEVDALVVAQTGGDRVFTLKGAEHVYRVLVEEMNEGAVTLNPEGLILFGNNALVGMLETPLETIIGAPMRQYIVEEDVPAFQSFIRRCIHTSVKLEVNLKKQSVKSIPVLLSGRKLAFGKDSAWISVVITDIRLQKAVEADLEKNRKELERKVEERTWELKVHEIELESQNEELRAAQHELHKSQRNYAELYEQAPVGYFSIDPDGVIQGVNNTGAALVGMGKGELTGKPFQVLISDSHDRDVFFIHKKATLETQTPRTCDLKLRRADKGVFWAHLESIAATYADCKSGLIRTTVIDITDRKRAEDAVRESEAALQSFFDSSSFLMGVMEIHGAEVVLMQANHAAAAFFGRSAILSGRTGTELGVPKEMSRLWIEHFRRAQLEGSPVRFDFEYAAPSGRRWLNATASFLSESSGRRARFSVVAEDITDRRRMEAAIKDIAEKYSTIVSTTADGIWMQSLDGVIREVNDAYCRMSGYSPTELSGMPINMLEAAESPEEVAEHIQKVVQGDGRDRFESKHRRKDGSVFDVDITALYVPAQKGMVIFVRDITERKRAEEALRQSEEKYRSLFENLTAAALLIEPVLDSDGRLMDLRCLTANSSVKDQLGKTQDELVGRLFSEVFNPERNSVFDIYEKVLSSGEPFKGEILLPALNKYFDVSVYRPVTGRLALVLSNISERILAEEALNKNQEQLREYVKLLEYAPLMVRNMKEEIILWNKGMERLYGYSPAEAIGRKTFDLLKTRFPETGAEIMNQLRRAGTWEGELHQATSDGRVIIVSSQWILYRNEEGRKIAVIEINNDVTSLRIAEETVRRLNQELESRVRERTANLAKTVMALQSEVVSRTKAEKALRESEFHLAKAQSLAHIGSWGYDLRAGKFTASDEFYAIFGMNRLGNSLDLKELEESVHPDDREQVRAKLGKLMAGSTTQSLLYRIIRPDGDVRAIWTEAEVVTDTEGKAVSVIGTVHDITERKQAEEELVRLATAIESAADALVVTEPQSGIIQYANSAFEKMTGYAREEVIGRDLHMLDSGRHDEGFYCQLRDTLARDGSWSGRLIQKRKDGTLYEEECTYSPVKNSAGELINYISIKRDVTEKTRLESIAQAVDTMNNIGYIFAGVSHELGNPVNAMGMTLDLMTRKLDTLSGDKIRQYVDHMTTQVRSIEYLLKNLKNFNMYESVELKSLDISQFLEMFLAMVRKDFGPKGVAVDCIVEPGAKTVYADPRALQQVLLNILTNAADAVAGREQPGIKIHVSATGSAIRLRIGDNGRGIEESRLNQLFKPFHTTKPRGTGLGLVIIRKMMTKMNGTVEITSTVNVGTVVVLHLPASEN